MQYLGTSLLAVVDHVSGQLGVRPVGGGVQAAAGTDEVADAHVGFERIIARNLHAAVDVHDLHRPREIGLHAQLIHERLDDRLATGLEIEGLDGVARHQRRYQRPTPASAARQPSLQTAP